MQRLPELGIISQKILGLNNLLQTSQIRTICEYLPSACNILFENKHFEI
ncbi:30871_t:CDS:2 [Gigaspora margarita]|uniref:30871_t:CDS:1 n=1 Tax=Gigaspora margarita TaxID=4874 RepID=A0ABM8W2K2_GIGMA|nr:30871_t:CDS:2 [Gigaspora margarita]